MQFVPPVGRAVEHCHRRLPGVPTEFGYYSFISSHVVYDSVSKARGTYDEVPPFRATAVIPRSATSMSAVRSAEGSVSTDPAASDCQPSRTADIEFDARHANPGPPLGVRAGPTVKPRRRVNDDPANERSKQYNQSPTRHRSARPNRAYR